MQKTKESKITVSIEPKKKKNYLRYWIVGINFLAIWFVTIFNLDPLTKMKVLDWLMQLSFMFIAWFFVIIPVWEKVRE